MASELEKRLREIDLQAERKKVAATYLVSFIEGNIGVLREAFLPGDTPEEVVTIELYGKVRDSWNDLTHLATRAAGVTISHLTIEQKELRKQTEPEFKLGWIDYQPILTNVEQESGQRPYIPVLTSTGYDLIDGYRLAQGLLPLKEQHQHNCEELSAAIQSARSRQ